MPSASNENCPCCDRPPTECHFEEARLALQRALNVICPKDGLVDGKTLEQYNEERNTAWFDCSVTHRVPWRARCLAAEAALTQANARLSMVTDFDLPDGKGWISHEGEVWNLYLRSADKRLRDPKAFPTADAAFAAASALDGGPAEEKTSCLP